MPTIFISYRREDSAGHAGRLFDRLREHFGKDRVFLDVVGIDAGVDFVETIDQAVGSCDVLLAVIGREWLTCCDKQNRRRLDDPNDFIRTEISAALKRNVRVVPVLVEGAAMPPTDALPEDLQRLTRRQAVELRDSRWDADIEALIAALERDSARTGAGLPRPAPPPARSGPVEPAAERKPDRKALLWGGGALVALLIAAGVILSFWPGKEPPPDDGSQVSTPLVEPEETKVSESPAEPTPEETTGGIPPRDDQTPEPEPRTVQAPDLVGLSLQAASDQLRAAGLEVGRREARQTAEAPARQVLNQWPPPGKELDRGTSVDLVYAEPLPDTRIAVPDVIGTQYPEALKTLQDAGFKITRRTEPSKEAQNTVLRQDPAAGSRVEKGARITLIYAVPVVTGIEVPDVVGKDVREATAILQKAGLDRTPKAEPSREAKHTVLRQEPAARKQVEKGTKVTLIYAIPVDDLPPDKIDRTIVYIWYNDEAERATAAELASFLRDLRLPGADFKISLAKPGMLRTGKIYYASRSQQAKLASDIAHKSSELLSKATGREVIIQMELDPKVAESGLILMLPKL